MAEIKCIDVSEWQGTVDWKKVKAAGYGYAILRAGFGREATQKDKEFEKNYKNAKAAGVKLGAYWYAYCTDKADAQREAKACLSVLKGKFFELPVFYDMEDNSIVSLGKTKLTECAKAFCEELKKGGYAAGVYSNPDWFKNYLNYNELKSLYPVWLAQYYKEPQYTCDIWQYSSEGAVNGISGNVDLNIIYNEKIIKSNSVTVPAETEKKVNLETALLQALLRQAYAQGLCKTFIKPIDNKKGKLIDDALVECRNSLGYKNPDNAIDLEFIKELEHQINVIRIDKENKLKEELKKVNESPAGDINGDGSVNVRDVTALQKRIAGI